MRSIYTLLIAIALAAQLFAAQLFGDRVVAKGKGFEIKASQVEETFILFKANRVAIGQPTPQTTEDIKKAEREILDSLISSKLILQKATEADRKAGLAEAEKFIKDKKAAATSENAYRRQLVISGVTPEVFEKEVVDQAIIKAVVDRELRGKQTVTDADAEKFYKDNPKMFEEPEKWKVAHIYLGNRDRTTKVELTEKEKTERKRKLADTLVRARAGVDFATLVKEISEHTLTKETGGEQTFVKGQMPPEFEAAALSMKPGQISDVVATGIGWHIIKFIERVPPKQIEFATVKDRIKERLTHNATQAALPDFVKKLREEAQVEVSL